MISCFVGIDVSKATLDVALWPQHSKPFQVKNTPEGIEQLLACLNEFEVGRVLLEATGGYERLVFTTLQVAGLEVVCINPKRARQFASAMGKIAKTDKIDALMLARFAEHVEVKSRVEPSEERDELTELVKQRDRFVQQRDDDKRRIKQARCTVVITNYTAHIAYLNEQVKALERSIDVALQKLNSDKARQLRSVKGIGLITTASLMAYLPELGTLTGREIAALAGLAPYNNDSGAKNGVRKISGGRHKVRRATYMSCWVMIIKVPSFKERYNALRARGKCAKAAVVACMRVLLVRLNAMLRDGTSWIDVEYQAPAA